MDGCPIKGNNNSFTLMFKDEIIPVRMYLCNYDLTPSYSDKISGISNKFSVKYYISVVLID